MKVKYYPRRSGKSLASKILKEAMLDFGYPVIEANSRGYYKLRRVKHLTVIEKIK